MMVTLISTFLILLVPMSIHGTLTITRSGDPLTGSTISLECSIPTFTGTAGWINPAITTSEIHACNSGFCLPSNGAYPRYAFSVTANTFTVTITAATLDDDTWTCQQDSPADSGTITIGLKVAPTVCTLTNAGGTYTCTSSCVYPQSDIYIKAKINGTSLEQDLTTTAVSAPVCTSPESAYSGTVPTSFFTQSGDLYCECGITGYASTIITSNTTHVTERICECNAVLAVAIIGIIVFVVDVILTWIAHFQLLGNITCPLSLVTKSKSSEGKFKWKTERSLLRAVVTTGICVIALILCIIGIAVCKACQLGSPEQSERTGLILAAIGFAINLVVLILLIIMIGLNRCRVLTISSSNPKTERDGPDGQEGKHSAAESKPRTEVSPRSAGSPTSASKIRPKWKNNQVSDSNESDGSNDTPRGGKLGNVPAGRKLPMLTATALDVDGAQKANSLAPLNTTETKKLKKKKKRKSKEEKQDNGE